MSTKARKLSMALSVNWISSVQSARSVFEKKKTHDLRGFHSTTDSTLTDKIRLEGNTERSESNTGRSIGIITQKRVAVWKTVPISPSLVLIALRRPQAFKETRIALMRRICSFTDILFDAHGLCAPDGRLDLYGFSPTGEIPRR